MADAVSGVLLSAVEVDYALRAFEVLLRDRRPSPSLADFLARLRRSVVSADVRQRDTYADGSIRAEGGGAAGWLPGDVIDTSEAAAVLGISPAGVRDLVRRGRLPGRRVGGRWVVHAASVVERAELRARE